MVSGKLGKRRLARKKSDLSEYTLFYEDFLQAFTSKIANGGYYL